MNNSTLFPLLVIIIEKGHCPYRKERKGKQNIYTHTFWETPFPAEFRIFYTFAAFRKRSRHG